MRTKRKTRKGGSTALLATLLGLAGALGVGAIGSKMTLKHKLSPSPRRRAFGDFGLTHKTSAPKRSTKKRSSPTKYEGDNYYDASGSEGR